MNRSIAAVSVMDDPERAGRVRVLRAHSSMPSYDHKLVGGSFQLDTPQAAVRAGQAEVRR